MIPAMKAAIAWKSGDPAWATVRPPLVELNAEQRTALQAALDENGFDMPGAQTLADN
jgi:4-hydroxy-tetrahydrodipicolinate synthase